MFTANSLCFFVFDANESFIQGKSEILRSGRRGDIRARPAESCGAMLGLVPSSFPARTMRSGRARVRSARNSRAVGNTGAVVLVFPALLLLLLAWLDSASALVGAGPESAHNRLSPPSRPDRAKPMLLASPPRVHESLRGGGAPDGAQQRIVMGQKTLLSRMTFSYVNALLEAGFDHHLETDELPLLPDENMAEVHVKNLEEAWLQRKAMAVAQASAARSGAAGAAVGAVQSSSEEQEKIQKAMLEKTLLGAVWDIFGRAFLVGGMWKVPQDILSFASPFLVKAMYKYVDPKEDVDPSQQTWSKGLGICALFFLVQYVASVALHQYFDEVFQVSLQIRAGLVACVSGLPFQPDTRELWQCSPTARAHTCLPSPRPWCVIREA